MKVNHDKVATWSKRVSKHIIKFSSRREMLAVGLYAVISFLSSTGCLAVVKQRPDCSVGYPSLPSVPVESACDDSSAGPQIRRALQHVCRIERPYLDRPDNDGLKPQRTIVIGFLGGFVKGGDKNHPEVWFANYLRQHYASDVYAEVFSNHNDKGAMRQVLRLLDTNCDGVLSTSEKEHAKIIVFGHSWGASEAAAFAQALELQGIPVLLTIQIDIVPKPFQAAYSIPGNVKEAVNFFQSRGLLHGRAGMVAIDPALTRILGNFSMTYTHQSVDCGNYPWFARTFNKPHNEIENDPRVWDRILTLIDAQIRLDGEAGQASLVPAEW